MKSTMRKISVLLLLVLFVSSAFTQDLNKAKEIYNEGAQAYNKKEYEKAIESFNEVLDICSQLGPDGEEIKMQTEMQLPEVYISYAKSIYKDDIDKAIELTEKASEFAASTSNMTSEEKANQLVAQLYNVKGKMVYKQKNLDEAVDYFKKAIAKDSSYSEAYFLIGVVYKKQDKDEAFKEVMLKGKKVADKNNDRKVYSKIVKIGKTHYYNKAIKKQKANNMEGAKKNLVTSLLFDEEFENAYYLLSLVNNELKKYDEAITAAEKALELNNGTDTDKAKIYFELGRAYQGKDNKEKACEAYKDAMYGAYTKSSEYQRNEILKCGE